LSQILAGQTRLSAHGRGCSPISTKAGRLLLTHGARPMRRYCIGAMLLDRDGPTRVIGRFDEPLLTPGTGRAHRLRPPRRLLLRRPGPQRHPGDSPRHQRRRHALRHHPPRRPARQAYM